MPATISVTEDTEATRHRPVFEKLMALSVEKRFSLRFIENMLSDIIEETTK